ncbi:HAMP domain-containing histidine kinase [Microbispora sp. RL4-1S]|uniref:histidine kinase n=1 Tax=Microbispora oryzae TaxID=2806554 RepID=A0A940WFN6_9ACTN|nr:HAMP domain-containing sensor histidine kinase [Microbispora oryzae]MBP2703853.1 HAMP domain-containing histidine kinase [Microbispora oryzae]
MTPRPSLGLRARLLFAFALLCVVTAAVVSGGMYVQARVDILQRAQDAAVQQMRTRLEALFPLRSATPGPAELGEIAAGMADGNGAVVAVYHDMRSPVRVPGPPPGEQPGQPPEQRRPGGNALDLDPAVIPKGLRREVAGGVIAWQRVLWQGWPILIIGAPLVIAERDGTTRLSGIEVYTARSLAPEQHSIAQLAASAWLTGGAALAFAVALALLATRGVLRPVRELGRAARLLGEGELRTRIAVRGSDELADVAHTFNNTAAQLERHVTQLREMEADSRRFVADVSHELRTPLAALAAVADVLDEEAARLPEPAGRAARLVSQETLNLTGLVNDLIEISRFDSGVAALALNEVDVAELVRATLRARGWTEQVHTELPPEVTARLDPRRVDVILANLVGNALRHGEPPVSVRLGADPDWIAVEVRDHGPGLDEAVLPHVFDRFYKASAARARSEGSGLGLAIARENARLHRGDLTVANAPGGGAVFTLRLPRRASDPDGGPE